MARWNINPYLYKQFSNDAGEMFDFTMTNIMDGFYNSSLSTTTDGTFKAVCLSGINDEANDGTSTSIKSAQTSSVSFDLSGFFSTNYINIIVRPLQPFGQMIVDPRLHMGNSDMINDIISMHKSSFTARSDYSLKYTDAIQFGQIIECYFEDGSISNSDFKSLRFKQPTGVLLDPTFVELGTALAADGAALDWDWTSASLLGNSTPYDGNLVTVSGTKKYLGSRSSGISPPGFWKSFRKKIEAHIQSEYPELGFKVANLGVTRDLAAAADRGSNKARASGSKHGAGLAQDLYLHTEKYGKYTSYKRFNPILAQDQKLVNSIIRFVSRPEYSRIQWGGAFGSGKRALNIGDTPKGRGELEFHHFEFKNNEIPNLFKGFEAELVKLGIKPSELTGTRALAKLYKKLL